VYGARRYGRLLRGSSQNARNSSRNIPENPQNMNHRPFVVAGLMGWPVSHSRSPDIHNHWIAQLGLRGSYVLLPVAPENLGQALRALPVLGIAGCNLTIPHKVAAMALVDHVDPVARRIGAINTIVVQPDGSLAGRNTDAYGYMESLMSEAPDWTPAAGPVAVMGAGGAARAIIVGLADKGVTEIRLCNRSPDKAQALAREFGAPVVAVPWEDRHAALQGAALLVNTTSQGMGEQPPLDLSLDLLPADALVSDLVYVPLRTPLLAAAQARGNRTVGGLGMLLHQARPAFEAWFGVMPHVTPQLRALVEKSL
jgi:shikimate dehydrogenase